MFPLPLTGFEEYMLRDDRPSHPMVIFGRCRFSGHLERGALERSVEVAAGRHPLLRCTVERRPGRRSRWIHHQGWRVPVTWDAELNRYGFPDAPWVDPTERPATRAWVADRGSGHDVFWQVHHCAADAVGLGQVVGDWLASYAASTGAPGGEEPLRPLEPARLRLRGRPFPIRGGGWTRARSFAPAGVWEFLSRRPVPLVEARRTPGSDVSPAAFPCPRVAELTRGETAGLRTAAASRGVTENDLMLRDLFVAVAGWRRERPGNDSGRGWLRVAVPIGLRRRADLRMPMANAVSMVFLDRRGEDLRDGAALLGGLHDQMTEILRRRLQNTFLSAVDLARRVPGALAAFARADSVVASAALSNVGPVLARGPLPRRDGRILLGDVELESVDGVIPLRPNMQAAFITYTYAGRRRILLHADPRALDDDEADALLARFVGEVRGTLA